MSDKIDLLPCPFCGGKCDPSGWLRGDGIRGPECEQCGATASTVEDWNQRATLSQQPAPAAVPDGYVLMTPEQLEKHTTTAWECPPQSLVVLASSLKRLHAKNFAAPAPAAQEPVAWQARFTDPGREWSTCSKEHHALVQANPREWPGYETRELYAAPPAAERPEAPRLPELLIALGCAGIAVSGGTHGDPWRITLPTVEQPDTVSVPRDLAEGIDTAVRQSDWPAAREAVEELGVLLDKESV